MDGSREPGADYAVAHAVTDNSEMSLGSAAPSKAQPDSEPEGRKRRNLPVGHPSKISPIGGRSSGAASEARWAVTHQSPGQRPNLDYGRAPGVTGQTGRIGLITRRSRVQIPPPPPRPLVRRAPRAGLQASDQRFLVLVPVGGAGFSGVFLGALSRLHRACHGRVARRVRPLSCQFAAGFSSELMVPSAAHGMRTQRPDQPIFGRFPEISL